MIMSTMHHLNTLMFGINLSWFHWGKGVSSCFTGGRGLAAVSLGEGVSSCFTGEGGSSCFTGECG